MSADNATVLGLNSQLGAQQLARLLIADPLAAEEQWERDLVKAGDGSENAVLLKWVHSDRCEERAQ